jgi:hypothetical protein
MSDGTWAPDQKSQNAGSFTARAHKTLLFRADEWRLMVQNCDGFSDSTRRQEPGRGFAFLQQVTGLTK